MNKCKDKYSDFDVNNLGIQRKLKTLYNMREAENIAMSLKLGASPTTNNADIANYFNDGCLAVRQDKNNIFWRLFPYGWEGEMFA